MFELHPTLKADTHIIGEFPLCLALLMNNSHVPWVILVPKRVGLRELYELSATDQQLAFAESLTVSQALMAEFKGDKLNTAAIGNMVAQLHLHHIVRFRHDPVWPQPVWGNLAAKPYTKTTCQQMLKRLRIIFTTHSADFKTSNGAS